MPRRSPNFGDRQANPRGSAGVTNRIRRFRFGCSPRLPVEIRLMRETKSRRSLRPIDISYRNDLKKWVGISADRRETTTADWEWLDGTKKLSFVDLRGDLRNVVPAEALRKQRWLFTEYWLVCLPEIADRGPS
jgi:hypothetical protein